MQLLQLKVKIVVIMFCECTGKLFFPLLVGVNFILSGFELITFHLSESRGSGGMLPWEKFEFSEPQKRNFRALGWRSLHYYRCRHNNIVGIFWGDPAHSSFQVIFPEFKHNTC